MRVDEMCGMCGCGFVQMPFMLINVDFGHFGWRLKKIEQMDGCSQNFHMLEWH
jgi:hypothetical protein